MYVTYLCSSLTFTPARRSHSSIESPHSLLRYNLAGSIERILVHRRAGTLHLQSTLDMLHGANYQRLDYASYSAADKVLGNLILRCGVVFMFQQNGTFGSSHDAVEVIVVVMRDVIVGIPKPRGRAIGSEDNGVDHRGGGERGTDTSEQRREFASSRTCCG